MDVLVDSNLNADAYRNMSTADRPLIFDKHLEFLSVYDDKSVILGSSNMTDRYWGGTLWFFDQNSDLGRLKATAVLQTKSGICCGSHLEQNKFIIGEDSGVLQILGLNSTESTKEIQCLGHACQHDDSLTTLSVSYDKIYTVTGGMDYCIKLWDTNEMIATHSYNYAHTDVIKNVDMQPNSNTIFVSASMDGDALTWDVRQPKPAHRILNNKGCALTAITWHPNGEVIAVGMIDGKIELLDHRNVSKSLKQEFIPFSRPVHKLEYNRISEKSQQMACCAEDISVKVIDMSDETPLISYENNHHEDFVRGLAWYNNKLYSCSWDESVLIHDIEF